MLTKFSAFSLEALRQTVSSIQAASEPPSFSAFSLPISITRVRKRARELLQLCLRILNSGMNQMPEADGGKGSFKGLCITFHSATSHPPGHPDNCAAACKPSLAFHLAHALCLYYSQTR